MISIYFLSFLFLLFAFLIFLTKPNLLFILFALEIILLGINTNFIFGSIFLDDFLGSYMALILFSVAALDTSIGLVIILNYYNIRTLQTININIKA